MFTSNQIEEIRKKLQLMGKKDTSFPLAESLKGNETIAIVQQEQNKRITLKTLLDKIGISDKSGFINLSKSNNDFYTLEEAINLVESANRKAGQVITFIDNNTKDWVIYQFKGDASSEWFNLELWDNILNKISKFDVIYSKDFNDFDCTINEIYADRAIKDALGRIIHDTYITNKGLTDFVIEKVYEEVLKQIINIQIQDGSITWDKLSEGVKQLLKSEVSITNLPDDEDLTVNEDNQLKFADKEFNPNTFSGYGRKILRKNIVAGFNVLEQYMINKSNTRYVIQYDYCLNEKTLEIPKDCILDMMQGGNLIGGTIHCNNTLIMIPDPKNIGVALTGTYTIFGSTDINIIDNLDSISTKDALSANQGKVLKEMMQSFMVSKKMSKAEYEALPSKSPDVVYLIV